MKILHIYVDENEKEYRLIIGQNQKENDQILRSCEQNDIWFHLENISGPHFILQNGGDTIPKKYLNQIATMFREFKNGLPNRYSVIYTDLKHVKLTKTMGLVIPSQTKTIRV
jgi:predicted ribosome quality control (RQC) complex YloA/Tae2 family protein